MLKNIPKIISPDLMKCMMDMGHSDFMILADANFPTASNAKRVIRLDGVNMPELLEAILKFYPLDNFVEFPVKIMKNSPSEPVPTIWNTYRKILQNNNEENACIGCFWYDPIEFRKHLQEKK